MAKLKIKYKTKLNPLRKIIKRAMDDTKNLEWSNDREIASMAVKVWIKLDQIFYKLGGFVDEISPSKKVKP
jgi:hypothetical protein